MPMRFVEKCNFILLKVGNYNGLNLNEQLVKESIFNGAFNNAPIVLKGKISSYKNKKEVEKYINKNCIGVVIPRTVSYCEGCVIANVLLKEKYSDKTEFCNWSIEYDDRDNYFEYSFCEVK